MGNVYPSLIDIPEEKTECLNPDQLKNVKKAQKIIKETNCSEQNVARHLKLYNNYFTSLKAKMYKNTSEEKYEKVMVPESYKTYTSKVVLVVCNIEQLQDVIDTLE